MNQRPPFAKILIANRGEIAVRIAHTLQTMGIGVVAIYSEADQFALHRQCADEAYALTGSSLKETYLNGKQIIEIAKSQGVAAIHPGYGFLSENAAFARACAAAGIKLIGPAPEAIAAMGDKIESKALMAKAGVPVIPGYISQAGDTPGKLGEEARRIGYPVLIKAAAGGGGKGMRRVDDETGLEAALESAAREAQNAFGDARVFLEKYLVRPRHIEFQVLADEHGHTVHLCERECSIQRRHQKIIEETPSVAVSGSLRRAMGEAAVKAAQAVNYANAGTVEFILAESGEFYFLEMNTRLQVEHPVTEMTLGLDLVQAQVRVAAGEALWFSQDDVAQSGHAIECRIYAEDPARNFMPATGTIAVYQPPQGPGIRLDSGVAPGSEIGVQFDPMLAKLCVWAQTRPEAIAKMHWALSHFVLLGVTTNLSLLKTVIAHPAFAAGETHTGFLDQHPAVFEEPTPEPVLAELAAWLQTHTAPGFSQPAGHHSDPWALAGAWRSA